MIYFGFIPKKIFQFHQDLLISDFYDQRFLNIFKYGEKINMSTIKKQDVIETQKLRFLKKISTLIASAKAASQTVTYEKEVADLLERFREDCLITFGIIPGMPIEIMEILHDMENNLLICRERMQEGFIKIFEELNKINMSEFSEPDQNLDTKRIIVGAP
jgi:hypothetical protein